MKQYGATAHVVNRDADKFIEELGKVINLYQDEYKLEVEVTYQIVTLSNDYTYTALVLGYKNVEVVSQ